MRQLLLMTLICSPICLEVYGFESQPETCKLDFSLPIIATNNEIELDNFCPTTAAEVVENLSENNEREWIWNQHWKNRIDDIVLGIVVLKNLSKKGANRASNLKTNRKALREAKDSNP